MTHEGADSSTGEDQLPRAVQMLIQVLLHLQADPAVDALPLPARAVGPRGALCDPLCDTPRCYIRPAQPQPRTV